MEYNDNKKISDLNISFESDIDIFFENLEILRVSVDHNTIDIKGNEDNFDLSEKK